MTTVESAAPRITVLGSVNMDLVATTERLPFQARQFSAPAAQSWRSNQAIAAAKSGGEVEFLGAVGDDTALELRETLVLNDVGTELLREVEGPSGVAFITADQSGENSIIVVGGANATVTDLSSPKSWPHTENASTLLCQFEIPIETVTAAAKHARAKGTIVMLNPLRMQPIRCSCWNASMCWSSTRSRPTRSATTDWPGFHTSSSPADPAARPIAGSCKVSSTRSRDARRGNRHNRRW